MPHSINVQCPSCGAGPGYSCKAARSWEPCLARMEAAQWFRPLAVA